MEKGESTDEPDSLLEGVRNALVVSLATSFIPDVTLPRPEVMDEVTLPKPVDMLDIIPEKAPLSP